MTNMRREKTQLLCTFSNPKRLKKTLDEIVENYDVFQNKVYIFEDEKNKNLMLTYNIVLKENAERKKHLPRTIIVQRKKRIQYFIHDKRVKSVNLFFK